MEKHIIVKMAKSQQTLLEIIQDIGQECFLVPGGMGLWTGVSMTTPGVFHIFPLSRKYPI